jgi:anti-sigma regulatory factor (Ser/Thr protein kinase)
MAFSEQAEFPSRMTALRDTAAFAQSFCERHGVDRDDALRLTLVIEELFTNTVKHGHRNENDSPVRIRLSMSDDGVSVLYEDRAPRYDPLARLSVAPKDLAASAEARPVGGLGVYLLGQLVAGARYSYEDGCNRLWFTMPRQG